MDRVVIENILEKSNCGLGSNTPSLISNTFRFAIPLNPPYQRGTFQVVFVGWASPTTTSMDIIKNNLLHHLRTKRAWAFFCYISIVTAYPEG